MLRDDALSRREEHALEAPRNKVIIEEFGVEYLVRPALTKMDKPDADFDKVKTGLSQHGVLAEDWGGDTVTVPVSAKTREGLPALLEMLLLQADLLDLKANPTKPARGTIVEAKLDRGRGPVATVLVQRGTLNVGGGSFRASNANDAMVLAQSWLDALPDESLYGFNVWTSGTHQDLVVFDMLPPRLPQPAQGVPEPGSLALAALGFGALFAARRRTRFSAAV